MRGSPFRDPYRQAVARRRLNPNFRRLRDQRKRDQDPVRCREDNSFSLHKALIRTIETGDSALAARLTIALVRSIRHE